MTDHPATPPDDPTPANPAEETGDGAAIEDAAAVALARAREAARAAGLRPSASGRTGRRRRPGTDTAGEAAAAANGVRSGEGRDPVTLGAQLDRLVAERGWQADLAVGSVIARWPAVIGPIVAQHVTPETFEDGVLTVRADSTSWATELRYMIPVLLERLAAEVGEGMVTDLRVVGPAGRSWRHGRRTAPGGRGPRDTYG
ncbi:MAG: DUF721 domain-containing protein [Austwickia sp.]|nr:MAG: DUF721 domain-containing protein [Austwickia sp.]